MSSEAFIAFHFRRQARGRIFYAQIIKKVSRGTSVKDTKRWAISMYPIRPLDNAMDTTSESQLITWI